MSIGGLEVFEAWKRADNVTSHDCGLLICASRRNLPSGMEGIAKEMFFISLLSLPASTEERMQLQSGGFGIKISEFPER